MFDKEIIELACAKCGHKFNESVGRLNAGDYACPNCGGLFDTTEFRRGLEDSERLAKEAFRNLGSQ